MHIIGISIVINHTAMGDACHRFIYQVVVRLCNAMPNYLADASGSYSRLRSPVMLSARDDKSIAANEPDTELAA